MPRNKKTKAPSSDSSDNRVVELKEALDIIVPELAARVAAIEHLLLEKQVCSREDLLRSREFVDARREKAGP
jgi:hypothetical protein